MILLGPNGPDEASSVLNVVRFYKKLMVRNVMTKIKVLRRTMGVGRWVVLLTSSGAVYNQVITVNFLDSFGS